MPVYIGLVFASGKNGYLAGVPAELHFSSFD